MYNKTEKVQLIKFDEKVNTAIFQNLFIYCEK